MSEATPAPIVESPIEDVLRALTDRQSEIEVRLDDFEVRFPFLREPLSVRGTLTLRLNMRETPPTGARSRRRA